jgi:hypothetical protein
MKISGVGLPYDPFADTVLLSNKAKTPLQSLRVYPNPGRGQVWFSGFSGKAQMRLYAADGKVVYAGWVENGLPISLAHLPKGLYTYLARQGDKQWGGKWVKE